MTKWCAKHNQYKHDCIECIRIECEPECPAPEPRAPQPDVMEALNRVIQDSKLRHIEQKVWQNLFERLTNLVHEAGKIAVEMGEDWRVNHPEFMDSLEAASAPPAEPPAPTYEEERAADREELIARAREHQA